MNDISVLQLLVGMSILIRGIEHNMVIRKLSETMTGQAFFEFCQANKELRIERDEKGNIIIISPVGLNTGYLEQLLASRLFFWNESKGLGITYGASTGFTLPDGSIRSPDASWLSLEKYQLLREEDKEVFPPVCPEFVAEIRSRSDTLKQLQEKMEQWIKNGVLLGWLIDPLEEQAFVYDVDSVEKVDNFDQLLYADPVLPGFELKLGEFRPR